jgi:hypothetical protein
MFCKQCGAQLAPGIKFCTTCGQAVIFDAPQPAAQMGATNTAYNFSAVEPDPLPKKKPPFKWIALGAAAVVAVLVTAISISAAEDAKYLKPENSPELATSLSAIKVEVAAQDKCSALAATIPSDATIQALISRTGVMNKYGAGAARRASAFLSSTSWIDGTEITDITTAMDDALIGALDDVIAKTPAIREADRVAFAELWAPEFKTLAISKCGLESQMAAALGAQSGFSSAKDNLETLAASVPWYPDGFNEWSDDSSIAWKWVDGGGCNLGDWCWHIKVITEGGCPNGVYAEMNILDSADNVVDYSNDTVPSLAAGSTALLEFATYNSTHAAGQMVTITCHGDY